VYSYTEKPNCRHRTCTEQGCPNCQTKIIGATQNPRRGREGRHIAVSTLRDHRTKFSRHGDLATKQCVVLTSRGPFPAKVDVATTTESRCHILHLFVNTTNCDSNTKSDRSSHSLLITSFVLQVSARRRF